MNIESIEKELAGLGKSFCLSYDTRRKVWTWTNGKCGGSNQSLVEVIGAIRRGEPDPIPCVYCIDCGHYSYSHSVQSVGDRFDPRAGLVCPVSANSTTGDNT